MSIIETLLDETGIDPDDIVDDEDTRESINETVRRDHAIDLQALVPEPPTDDLVAYYPFDGDTEAEDSILDGTFTGETAEFVDGVTGQAIDLEDRNEYVQVDTSGDKLTPSGAEWTMAAWVYSEGPTGNGDQIIRRDESEGGGFLYNIRLNEDRSVRLEYDKSVGESGGTIESFSTTEETVSTGEWTHVAAVIDSEGAEIYIDGDSQADNSDEGDEFNSISGGELSIGAFGLAEEEYFNGAIDEVRLYDRALSEEEIEELADQIDTQ